MAVFGLPGGTEWIVIALVALLLFGRRLPEVARSVGKSIVEFKRGMKDVRSEIDEATRVDSGVPRQIEHKPSPSGSTGETSGAKLPEGSESTTPR